MELLEHANNHENKFDNNILLTNLFDNLPMENNFEFMPNNYLINKLKILSNKNPRDASFNNFSSFPLSVPYPIFPSSSLIQKKRFKKGKKDSKTKNINKKINIEKKLHHYALETKYLPLFRYLQNANKFIPTEWWILAREELKFCKVYEKYQELLRIHKSSIPLIPKPQKLPKFHNFWDDLLEECRWMYIDFHQERNFKIKIAKQIALEAQNFVFKKSLYSPHSFHGIINSRSSFQNVSNSILSPFSNKNSPLESCFFDSRRMLEILLFSQIEKKENMENMEMETDQNTFQNNNDIDNQNNFNNDSKRISINDNKREKNFLDSRFEKSLIFPIFPIFPEKNQNQNHNENYIQNNENNEISKRNQNQQEIDSIALENNSNSSNLDIAERKFVNYLIHSFSSIPFTKFCFNVFWGNSTRRKISSFDIENSILHSSNSPFSPSSPFNFPIKSSNESRDRSNNKIKERERERNRNRNKERDRERDRKDEKDQERKEKIDNFNSSSPLEKTHFDHMNGNQESFSNLASFEPSASIFTAAHHFNKSNLMNHEKSKLIGPKILTSKKPTISGHSSHESAAKKANLNISKIITPSDLAIIRMQRPIFNAITPTKFNVKSNTSPATSTTDSPIKRGSSIPTLTTGGSNGGIIYPNQSSSTFSSSQSQLQSQTQTQSSNSALSSSNSSNSSSIIPNNYLVIQQPTHSQIQMMVQQQQRQMLFNRQQSLGSYIGMINLQHQNQNQQTLQQSFSSLSFQSNINSNSNSNSSSNVNNSDSQNYTIQQQHGHAHQSQTQIQSQTQRHLHSNPPLLSPNKKNNPST